MTSPYPTETAQESDYRTPDCLHGILGACGHCHENLPQLTAIAKPIEAWQCSVCEAVAGKYTSKCGGCGAEFVLNASAASLRQETTANLEDLLNVRPAALGASLEDYKARLTDTAIPVPVDTDMQSFQAGFDAALTGYLQYGAQVERERSGGEDTRDDDSNLLSETVKDYAVAHEGDLYAIAELAKDIAEKDVEGRITRAVADEQIEIASRVERYIEAAKSIAVCYTRDETEEGKRQILLSEGANNALSQMLVDIRARGRKYRATSDQN